MRITFSQWLRWQRRRSGRVGRFARFVRDVAGGEWPYRARERKTFESWLRIPQSPALSSEAQAELLEAFGNAWDEYAEAARIAEKADLAGTFTTKSKGTPASP